MTRKSVKNKRSRKAGRGVLILITGFFLTSGVLRLGSGTGSAIAREIQSLSHPETRTVADVTPVACEPDEEGIGDLLAALKNVKRGSPSKRRHWKYGCGFWRPPRKGPKEPCSIGGSRTAAEGDDGAGRYGSRG